VDLEFRALDTLGHIGCRVELAAPFYGVIRPEQEPRVKLELLTSYEPLRTFARGLQAVVSGQAQDAVLDAHGPSGPFIGGDVEPASV
jgi:hypothetical protein